MLCEHVVRDGTCSKNACSEKSKTGTKRIIVRAVRGVMERWCAELRVRFSEAEHSEQGTKSSRDLKGHMCL